MAEKNYVRLDKVGASDHYESFVADFAVANGQFLTLGAADESLGDEVATVTKAETGKRPDVLATTVFINYGELGFKEIEQELKPGKIGRGLHLVPGQIFSVNAENAAGVAKGDAVTVGADGKGIRKAVEAEEVIGQVIRLDYLAYVGDLVVIRVK